MGTDLLNRVDAKFSFDSRPEIRPFHPAPDKVDWKYFRRILDLCNTRAIEVVLVTTPVYAPEAGKEDHQRASDWLDATAKEAGRAQLNYSFWKNRDRFDYFYDMEHLSAKGALHFSREFAKDLSDLLR
ncbi:MAG: hypothetical protein ACI9R3_002297 [Verrucomicrobiales bacterium]|jgi:hypothetical protein